MFLAEPPQTQYDLHFQLFGIPVRVHPFFWLAGVILGASSGDSTGLFIWVGVLFVSIVIHEFGHAFTMRYYGESPRVVLYMMGGLAIADSSAWSVGYGKASRSPQNQILISAAGPGAGFLFAALILIVIVMSGGQVSFVQSFPFFWDFELSIPRADNPYLYRIVDSLLYVNICWGLVNLLPVYPLDGGQISREVCMHMYSDGVVRSLWLSVFAGGGMAVAGLLFFHQMFIAILFGLLAYSSYMTLQQYRGGGGGGYGGFGGRPW